MTGQSELAHAVALFLLPFAREIIGNGATPIHLVEKPSPGTGATLMVDCLAYAAIGRPIAAMTEGRDEDEWRKRLTSKFRTGAPYMFIDNLGRRLDSATVSAAVTAPSWEDRILGLSEMVRLPVRCVWVASGNNPSVSNEISRRSIRIRLDAKTDQPWLREKFKIPNLRVWVKENRGQLIWAALTMIRAWLAAGRPAGSRKLGMFEQWAETIGGILDVVGIPGFLGNLAEFYEESDTEGGAWRSFILTWWETFRGKEVKVSDLWEQIKDDTSLPIAADTDQAQKIRLGKLLSDKRDRTFSVAIENKPMLLRITRGGQKQRAYLWKLSECGECSEFSTTPALRTPAHAPAHEDPVENTHTHSLDSHGDSGIGEKSPNSLPPPCQHRPNLLRRVPTQDGFFNLECECGQCVGCEKAEPSP